jgi:ceramide glucosyltransferase
MTGLDLAARGMGWAFAGLAGAGSVYTVMAGLITARFFARPLRDPARRDAAPASVTLLKPLHGAEPQLRQNLASFFRQSMAPPCEIVMGVQSAGDPARGDAEAVMAAYPDVPARLVVDGARRGRNGKIANLINMSQGGLGEIVVLTDSDIAARPNYLCGVLAALAEPGVGVVTCPYNGVGVAGVWSRLAALGLTGHFLPNVLVGVSLGLATPCMGSTIALRRETLERIGGFEAFADVLADDYAIGAAVRALGLRSVVAPVLVAHASSERSLRDVFAHELRWAKTVKGVDPAGHAGSVVTHPLPLSVMALALAPSLVTAALFVAAVLARVWLIRRVYGVIGEKPEPWWLIPPRDMLSFCVFAGSFFVRYIEWRGETFHVTQDGDLRPV